MHIYVEIQADDCARAVSFYTTIFPSWNFTKDETLPIEYHRGYSSESEQDMAINILKRPMKTPPTGHGTNAFVCSFPIENVEDFDKMEKKVLELGGQVAMARFPIPERGWHGYFLDTEGNTFGVFTTTYRKDDKE